MNGDSMWQSINAGLSGKMHEIPTVPSNSKEPLWFKAYIELGEIFVQNATTHKPPTNMSQRRKISKLDFDTVFPYYHRWAKGESYLRQVVSRLSRNTAYIFALISFFENPRI